MSEAKFHALIKHPAVIELMDDEETVEFLKGVENPWWITNRELNENRQHRYSFNATMKLDITDWMSLTGRIRTHRLQGQKTLDGALKVIAELLLKTAQHFRLNARPVVMRAEARGRGDGNQRQHALRML